MSDSDDETQPPNDANPDQANQDDRIQVAVLDYTVSADVYAQYGADFDPEAVNDAVRAEVNRALPPGIEVARNGMVLATPQAAEQAGRMDWDALLAGVDLAQILATHPREQ